MPTKTDIAQLVQEATSWNRAIVSEKGPDYLEVTDKSYARTTFRIDALRKLDKRLPGIYKHLIADINSYKSYLHGDWARLTLSMWENPPLHMIDAKGVEHVVHSFDSITLHPKKARNLAICKITGSAPNTLRMCIDGVTQDVSYAVRTYPAEVHVPHQWLDQHYPGWSMRLLALEAMGETGKSLANEVFIQSVIVPEISLTGVNFDMLQP